MNILRRIVSRPSQLVVGEVYLIRGINAYKETIPPQIFLITAIHHDAFLPYIACQWWCNVGLSKEYDPDRHIHIGDLFKATLELEWLPEGKNYLAKLNNDQSYRDMALSTPTIISGR